MMVIKDSLYVMAAATLFFMTAACTNGGKPEDTGQADSLALEMSNETTPDEVDSVPVDTEGKVGIETEPEKHEEELQELKKDEFCECIRWQYRINKQMEEAETDAEIDAVFEEQDKYDSSNCKNVLAGNQNSLDAKAEHEAKVAACLSGMK